MQSFTQAYEGFAPQWQINLAISRIKAFRFPADQWPDIVQRLVLVMAEFQYDPARANGASHSTVLTRVINNQLTSIRRSEYRRRQRLQRHRERQGLTLDNAHRHPALVTSELGECQIDVRDAVNSLTSTEQQVCRHLMQGASLTQIASTMGICWHTVNRIVRRVRADFANKELDAWLAD